MKRISRLCCIATLAVTASAAAQQPFAIPDDVRANVRARVQAGWAPSVIVGVVDAAGTRYFADGGTSVAGVFPVDQRTVYEIGSITKVFTAVTLADMAVRGEVGLDDPVQRYLPAGARVPVSGAQPITLRLLSAQRSGLPRMPTNFAPRNPSNPYADYDADRLLEFLNGYTLTREPGSRYEYSNFGVGLLGLALSRRDGSSYETMVQRRVLAPLGMTSTMVTLSADAFARLAHGSADGRDAANWDLDALAGAGALRSTAEDMTRFLAAAMGLTHTTLDSAFRLAAEPQFDAGSAIMRIGLGWHIRERGGIRIVWHNGGTGGYRSWAGYDPARRIGVVVLTNSQENVDEIGFHMLDTSVALRPVRAAITLPAESLAAYVGRYPLSPIFVIAVTREGDRLMAQATNQPAFRIHARAIDEFFLTVVDAQVSFTRGADGRVNGLVLHQGGRDQRAERLP